MKKLFVMPLLVILSASNIFAQQHKDKIKQTAQFLIDATVNGDYSIVLDYTYPKFVALNGGKDSVLLSIKQSFDKMKAQGKEMTFKSGRVGDPGDEIKIGSLIYSVVPETLTIKINDVTYLTNGSLIGISSDKGGSWYFVDAANLNEVKELLPDIVKLNIPTVPKATVIKD